MSIDITPSLCSRRRSARRDAHAVHCHLILSRWCTLYTPTAIRACEWCVTMITMMRTNYVFMPRLAEQSKAEKSLHCGSLRHAKSNSDAIAALNAILACTFGFAMSKAIASGMHALLMMHVFLACYSDRNILFAKRRA